MPTALEHTPTNEKSGASFPADTTAIFNGGFFDGIRLSKIYRCELNYK